jgi:hypothetical protein
MLADVQSLRLDTRDSDADLARIGDKLADLVPALRFADSAAPRSQAPGDVRNSARRVRGAVVQGRDITGDVGTVIKGNHGSVHLGKGNIQHFSGDGAAYVEGDNNGGIGHHFGGSRKEDER